MFSGPNKQKVKEKMRQGCADRKRHASKKFALAGGLRRLGLACINVPPRAEKAAFTEPSL
jgi:hypothetical protein